MRTPFRRHAVACATFTALAACATAAHEEAPARDLSERIEVLRKEHDVPALAGAILAGGRIVAIGAAGLRCLGHDAPVTVDDTWYLGSCTKAMTATVVARLVERGELRFDATLGEVFGDASADWHPDYRAATVRQLLDHTAGLPRDFGLGSHWRALPHQGAAIVEGRRRALQPILEEAPPVELGTRSYSNVGFVLAGHVIEHVTGGTWEDAMRRELFEPLGMASAGFGEPGTPGKLDQPFGHTAGGVPRPPGTPGLDTAPFYGPAGLVHASLRDWAKFVALHVAGERGESGLLRADTLRAMHAPTSESPEYACGFNVVERSWASGGVLAHAGSNLCWYSRVWASPADDFAVFAVCNAGPEAGAKACDALAGALIELYLAAWRD